MSDVAMLLRGVMGKIRLLALAATVLSAMTVCSAFAHAEKPATDIVAASNLKARAVSSSRIDLRWADKWSAKTETAYVVERSADGATYAVVATLPANTKAFTDSGLTKGKTYHYRVRAMEGESASDYSNVKSVKAK